MADYKDRFNAKIGFVIQARLGSTRLPNKVLLPIGKDSMLLFLINRLETLGLPIIVATSESSIDDSLCTYLGNNNIQFVRGSEKNVLARFVKAGQAADLDFMIRICADNPFVEIELVRNLINELIINPDVDYLSYKYNEKPTILSHFGVFSEIVRTSALIKLLDLYDNEKYNEHVTFGIYDNPGTFLLRLIETNPSFKDFEGIRLTIDTPEDYNNVLKLIKGATNVYEMNFVKLATKAISSPEIYQLMNESLIKNKK